MDQGKNILRVFLSRIIGFLIFLILLAVVNILVPYVANEVFRQIVFFINSNVWLLIVITIVMMIGEMFGVLMFPFNLPAPLFNAIGAVFLIRFLFNIFEFLDILLVLKLPFDYNSIYLIVSLIVFIIIIVVGYIMIFSHMVPRHYKKIRHDDEERNAEKRKVKRR